MSVASTEFSASKAGRRPTNSQPVGVDVHALHKSATMFLFKFFRRLASRQQFGFYSENNQPPNPQGPSNGDPQNYCRCPIRSFETGQLELNANTQVHRIFQIRDPRDILVSEYFSMGWIHPTEGTKLDLRRQSLQQMSIDEYALTQSETSRWPLEAKFAPLMKRELNPEFETVVTYEEMVTDLQKWVEKVLPPFAVRFPKLAAIRMAWNYRHEFKAPAESMTHRRRITPGDHCNKLQPTTIDQLNQRFEKVLLRFGYLK